ncbi:MAG: 16S rRNA (uracil(1498)-N(3))-methyltransferase [Methylovirgula sp.]|nr:16S rRNA (uracil(1498)-N(3))-methyltransferase [Methylovirgula sp.]
MARYDFTTRRLFVEGPLAAAARIDLPPSQAHYLRNVLRLSDGAELLVFNGRDGEWRAALEASGRKQTGLIVHTQTRAQERPGDLHYLFAPLKHARLDYMVQKAVEMGASRLQPVLTRHTQAERLNAGRMQSNVIEAAEQCGILAVPEVAAPLKLEAALAAWPAERLLIFCDEEAPVRDPLLALTAAAQTHAPLAVLVGPEGGFDAGERAALLALPQVMQISLGPRILRADTAAVAVLALVQAALGDWRG